MSTPAAQVRLDALVVGRVQGVGFRAWTRSRGVELGLSGSATNRPDGGVAVVVEGPEPDVRALLELLRGAQAPGRVTSVTERWSAPRGVSGFEQE